MFSKKFKRNKRVTLDPAGPNIKNVEWKMKKKWASPDILFLLGRQDPALQIPMHHRKKVTQ